MTNIRLLPIDHALSQSLADDGFAAAFDVEMSVLGDLVRKVVDQTLAMSEPRPPWCGYLAVDDHEGVVGTCAFKSPPVPDGTLEIAYFTFPPFEGRGVATTMARLLLGMAWEAGEVRSVQAHTLPEQNASTRVLEKLGMKHEGEFWDPVDGMIWRWRVARPA